MTEAAATPAAPKKRGPNTPEGKARSSMNALKHGLRARNFGILPEEDKAEWGQHLQDLRQGYAPVDAAEEKLVTAIAVAMWNEIRADRTLVETMVEIPPCGPGRSHGSALQEPGHARSLGTAIRYMTAAGMATQRAQRAFFQHRKAKRDGLLLPVAEVSEPAANQNDTNEFRAASGDDAQAEAAVAPVTENRTNELSALRPAPGLLPARGPTDDLRDRLDHLLDGPGPERPEDWDLVAAIRALKQPGAPPYRGAIDPAQLEEALDDLGFAFGGLAWLASLRPAPAGPEQLPRSLRAVQAVP